MTAKNETKKVETKVTETVAEQVTANASKMTDSAREFVKRSAATAKERSDNLYEGTKKYNSGLESVLTRAVTGYVGFLGNLAEAAHANVDHALTTAEKLAAAKSLSEAAQIQTDYVRENTAANVERVRNAVNATREAVTEGANNLRENAAKVWPYGQKAA